jgi:hypothetical protein
MTYITKYIQNKLFTISNEMSSDCKEAGREENADYWIEGQ